MTARRRRLAVFAGTALLAAGLGLSGCEEEKGPAGRIGEKIDETVEQAGDKVEEASDQLGEAAEEAGDKAEEATDQ